MTKRKIRVKEFEEIPEKSAMFSRGYSPVRKRIEKGSKYTMSCYNCNHFYQADGDAKEMCQNPEVLKYDMIVTENGIYCNRWAMFQRVDSTNAKSIFKKRLQNGR